MDCSKLRAEIGEHLDFERSPDDVREHLSACPDCSRYVLRARLIAEEIAGLTRPEAPPELTASTRERALARPKILQRSFPRIAAAVLLIATGIGVASSLLLKEAAERRIPSDLLDLRVVSETGNGVIEQEFELDDVYGPGAVLLFVENGETGGSNGR